MSIRRILRGLWIVVILAIGIAGLVVSMSVVWGGIVGAEYFDAEEQSSDEYEELSPDAQEAFDEGEYHEELRDVDILVVDETVYEVDAGISGIGTVFVGGILLVMTILLCALLGDFIPSPDRNDPYREI